ncbi:MAG: tRNA (adenosine(37)-N6)-threonylcarbamoyltransferase complex ATPase subunit type 1 TsaE [Verrucomicrobia bacterium]|nr:tRNA (adenosine(37)-N6)-threonylcarbamoyltransferase complex ATPase subunit type 1 TsaE [Verrucomicrobiota bacterium]
MDTIISRNPDDTMAWGEQWGREARPGQVLALEGPLGAGKTQLVKGIARGLGIADRIQSPTFGLLISYTSGRCPLHHLDLYRLKDARDTSRAGLEDYLFPQEAITVIEWPDRWCDRDQRPPTWEWVRIETRGEHDRLIEHESTRD